MAGMPAWMPNGSTNALNSTFKQLLGQLAEVHCREIAVLELQLKNVLMERSGSHTSSNVMGNPRLRSPLMVPRGDDDNIQRKQCFEGKEGMHRSGSPSESSLRPHLNVEPKANDDNILSSKAAHSSSQSSLSMPPRYDTNMHWALDDRTPEEEDAYELANNLSKWRAIKFSGLGRDRLAQMILNWWGYREPTRKKTLIFRVVESKQFQCLTLAVIFLNIVSIVWITNEDITSVIDNPTIYRAPGALDLRFWVEFGFSVFYVIELSLRLYIHGQFLFVSVDWGWNVFDACLVVFSVFDILMSFAMAETSKHRPNLTFLRVLRVLRIARVLRMFRAVRWIQELRLMLDCVLHSGFHLFWCIVLILAVLLIFALLLVQGVTDHLAKVRDDQVQFEMERESVSGTFDTVPHAMLSLFQSVSGGGDWMPIYHIVQRAGPFYDVMFLLYIAFFAIVAWNIVMSTFVEKAMNLGAPDIDTMILEKRRKDLHYAKELTEILEECMDDDGNHVIGIDEFKRHMGDEKVKRFFQARDLDMKDAELFFRMLASLEDAHGHVDLKTFVMGCMQLRGMASNIDVQSLHYEMKNMFRHSRDEFQSLIATLIESIVPEDVRAFPQRIPITEAISRLADMRQLDNTTPVLMASPWSGQSLNYEI